MSAFKETAKSAGRLVRHALGAALSPVRAGSGKLTTRDPALDGPATLDVSSDAFGASQPIPKRCSAEDGGENISPALTWSGVPAATASLALIVEDPDAPMINPFIHWLIWNIPAASRGLPTGVPNAEQLASGAIQGRNNAKTAGYYGPLPPAGHGVHHYHFQLFALGSSVSLPPDSTLEDLINAMKGNVLAQGELVGTYERN